jgi:starch phosphorylase
VESIGGGASEVALGRPVEVSAQVFLDALTPDDVSVEIVTGRMNADGDITNFFTTPMHAAEQKDPGSYRFESKIEPGSRSGLYGYAIRVLPKHPDLVSAFLPGRILWACGDAGQISSVRREAVGAGAR